MENEYICPECQSLFTEQMYKQCEGICPYCFGEIEVFPMDNFTPVCGLNSLQQVNNMIQFIKQYGQKDTWQSIEKLINPFERIAERKAFFEALKQLKLEFNIGEK